MYYFRVLQDDLSLPAKRGQVITVDFTNGQVKLDRRSIRVSYGWLRILARMGVIVTITTPQAMGLLHARPHLRLIA